MKVVIAGGRDIEDIQLVFLAIELSGYEITQVVSGKARGVDTIGELYAIENKIEIKLFPADWSNQGKAAGVIRNGEMADYADAAIIVWDKKSPGTRNMIGQMKSRKKPYFLYTLDGKYKHY